MKKSLFFLTAIFVAFLLAGCQDEIVQEIKSPGEKIGEQITELAMLSNINHVKLWNTSFSNNTHPFTIDGEIMTVYLEGKFIRYYNLNYVQSFSIADRYVSIWFIYPYNP